MPFAAVVLGTRPEIIKLAAVIRGLGDGCRLVHTGQHYDPTLSAAFFTNFGLRTPDLELDGVGGAPAGRQIGAMISAMSQAWERDRPAVVIVQGDTNTASAGAQAARYVGVPVVHVEAGLRSFDRAMPEEINRQVVGVVADLHCAPTETAAANLRAEGVERSRIRVTGNTVVESTWESLPAERTLQAVWGAHEVEPDSFVLATIHRPENTDHSERLERALSALAGVSLPVLLPLHPRTRDAIARWGLQALAERLRCVEPVDHPTFLALAAGSRMLVSDSGGVQEECTVIKKPLVVVRNSTERPEAVAAGFSRLVRPGDDLPAALAAVLEDSGLASRLAAMPSPYGDGKASQRIVELVGGLLDVGSLPVRATRSASRPGRHGT